MAIDLALADICQAGRDLFDLHPGMRTFTVTISDDGEVRVRLVRDQSAS